MGRMTYLILKYCSVIAQIILLLLLCLPGDERIMFFVADVVTGLSPMYRAKWRLGHCGWFSMIYVWSPKKKSKGNCNSLTDFHRHVVYSNPGHVSQARPVADAWKEIRLDRLSLANPDSRRTLSTLYLYLYFIRQIKYTIFRSRKQRCMGKNNF